MLQRLSLVPVLAKGVLEVGSYPLLRICGRTMCTSSKRLDGKVVVITGASDGIGKATTLAFAQKGAKIIMAVRNVSKGNGVAEEIRAKVPNVDIRIVEVDLTSLDSVRRCAQEIQAMEPTIDILVNNAGIFLQDWKYEETKDGHEIHFGVNYLAHFLLTLLLLKNLANSDNGKVINVSSGLYECAGINFSDLNNKDNYDYVIAYGQSKLAQILFTRELAARFPQVKTYSISPGMVDTKAVQVSNESCLGSFFRKRILLSPEEGCQTILHCAIDEKADNETGQYYSGVSRACLAKYAKSSETGQRLWSESLKLVKLTEEEKVLDLQDGDNSLVMLYQI